MMAKRNNIGFVLEEARSVHRWMQLPVAPGPVKFV